MPNENVLRSWRNSGFIDKLTQMLNFFFFFFNNTLGLGNWRSSGCVSDNLNMSSEFGLRS